MSFQVLFPNDAVVMILARIIGMLGPIDLEMLMQGQEIYKYFTKEYDLYYINEVCFANIFISLFVIRLTLEYAALWLFGIDQNKI